MGRKSKQLMDSKILSFTELMSQGNTKKGIMKEMGIAESTYFKYLDTTEEAVWNYTIAMAEGGLLIQFNNAMNRVKLGRPLVDSLMEKAKDSTDRELIKTAIQLNNSIEGLVLKHLDDAKLVNNFNKYIQKNIVEKKAT